MDKLINILTLLFFTVSIVAVLSALLYLVRSVFDNRILGKTVSVEVTQVSPGVRSREEYINKALADLATNGAPAKAAEAFGILLIEGYVLLHILQNKGNNYNEEIQVKKYKQSLTQQSVDALFELEEHHGGYWL